MQLELDVMLALVGPRTRCGTRVSVDGTKPGVKGGPRGGLWGWSTGRESREDA